MDFATSYLKLLEEKDDEVEKMCVRLEGGLKKIAEAQVQLDDLNAKLVIQKVVVKEKSEACEKLLVVITENTKVANEKQEEAETKAVEIEAQSKIIQVGFCAQTVFEFRGV